MAETLNRKFFAADRCDALRVAVASSPHCAWLLNMDIWVVTTLYALFEVSFGKDLAF